MKILYLTEDYVGSRVHHNLCRSIVEADNQMDITLFAFNRPNYPLRDLRDTYTDSNYHLIESDFDGNMLLYRTLFPYKIRCKYRQLTQKAIIENINLTIASTLFSDGAVAYKLWRERGIPYIVVVRGTDVNLYLRRMPHLYRIGRQIVVNAKKVVFISPVHRKIFEKSQAFSRVAESLQPKSVTISNGIDQIWIDNQCFDDKNRQPDTILYIGAFDSNKNIETLIEACQIVRKQNPQLALNLIGGGGNRNERVLDLVNRHQDWIKFFGPVYNKLKLIEICRQNTVFAMISISETFGLVYLEALSQGLPVVYTDGQGFSGTIPDLNVGCAVNPKSAVDVAEKLKIAFANRKMMLNDIRKIKFDEFCWPQKAQQWLSIIK